MGGHRLTRAGLLGRASGLVAALCVAAPVAAQDSRSDDPIIIVGQRNSAGLRADSEIDENAIAGYGVDTVSDLLGAIASETDPSGEGPVILINGQPASGIDEIADLPTEAVSKIQILSRDAAATLGQRPTRRVVNVVIRPDHRQVTLGATGQVATEGEGRQGEGSVNLLKLDGGNRRSLALKVTETDRLDEADRDILSAPDEFDANRFKSLIPQSLVASANGTISQKFGTHLVSLTVRGERSENRSRLGASALVPERPLDQRGDSTVLTGAAVANGPLGSWRYSLNGNVGWRRSRTTSDRDDPLADDPIFRDSARSRSVNSGLLGTLTGSPFTLPAGKANAALRLEWRGTRATSINDVAGSDVSRRIRRDDLTAQMTLQLPLITSKAVGDIGAELSGALRHVTASGSLQDWGAAINWRPSERFTVRAAINREQVAPPPNALTDPLVTIDNVRVFDFIRQETVLVTYLTGGNRDLEVERRRRTALGVTWQPLADADLNLSFDYVGSVGRGAFAALPPVNADVQAAFPDRFQRDGGGRLIAVDARPVPFALVRRQEIRTGATFYRSFGRTSPVPSGGGSSGGGSDDQPALGRGWRVNAFVAHQWTLKSERQARSGLPVIDLLDGGALGYGGGQPRHRLQFGAGVVHRGVGLQLDGDWTGASRIAAGTIAAPDELRFDSQALLDARLFANLGALMPERRWAKGLRITLAADNLFDSKRRVTNSSGTTPLGYQRYLLDPLGRTISLSLRKVSDGGQKRGQRERRPQFSVMTKLDLDGRHRNRRGEFPLGAS